MKQCRNCGAQLSDDSIFCQICGTKYEDKVADYQQTNMYQPDMNYQQVYMNQDNRAYQQQGAYVDYNGYQQQGIYHDTYGYQQAVNKKRKFKADKLKKNPLIIAVIVCMIALVSVGAIFLFKSKGLSEQKAQKLVKNYIRNIEKKDVVGVIEATIPEKLAEAVLEDFFSVLQEEYGDEEFKDSFGDYRAYDEYDELIELLQDTMEEEGINEELEDIDIDFSNVEVTDVYQFDFDDYIDSLNSTLKKCGIEDTTVESMFEDAGYEMDNVKTTAEEYLNKYDMSFNDIYIIDLSFKLAVSMDGEGEIEIDSKTYYLDHMFAYKYDNEWYLIPGLESSVVVSLVRYIGKSQISNDISSAKTIKTAVETTMGNETCYEFLCNKGVVITIYPDKMAEDFEVCENNSTATIDNCNSADYSDVMKFTYADDEDFYCIINNDKNPGYCQDYVFKNIIENMCYIDGRTPDIKYKKNAGDSESKVVPEVYYVYVAPTGMVSVFVGAEGNEEYVRTTDVIDDDERCIYSLTPETCDSYW